MNIEVILHIETETTDLPTAKAMSHWVNLTASHITHKIPPNQTEVTLCIIDEATSAELNQKYRNKTGPTNVLSFPDTPLPGLESESLGDIAICAQKVKSEALAQHKTLEAHWAHLVIHGFLHLLGYDHIQDPDAKIMESLETELLSKLGYPNPYQ